MCRLVEKVRVWQIFCYLYRVDSSLRAVVTCKLILFSFRRTSIRSLNQKPIRDLFFWCFKIGSVRSMRAILNLLVLLIADWRIGRESKRHAPCFYSYRIASMKVFLVGRETVALARDMKFSNQMHASDRNFSLFFLKHYCTYVTNTRVKIWDSQLSAESVFINQKTSCAQKDVCIHNSI